MDIKYKLYLIVFLFIGTGSFCMEEKKSMVKEWSCGQDSNEIFGIKFNKKIKIFSINHDNTILVVHFEDNTLQLFDLTKEGAPIWQERVFALSYKICPHRNIIAIEHHNHLELYHMTKEKELVWDNNGIFNISTANQWLNRWKEQYVFSHDGQLIFIRMGDRLWVYNLSKEWKYIWYKSGIDDFYVFSDKNIVVILFDNAKKIALYDVTNKKYLWKEPLTGTFLQYLNQAFIRFYQHGEYIFLIDDCEVLYCYNLQKEEIWNISNVKSFRLSEEGDMIAVISIDGELQLYRLGAQLEKVWEEPVKNVWDIGIFSTKLNSIAVFLLKCAITVSRPATIQAYDFSKERKCLWNTPIKCLNLVLCCFDMRNNNNFISYIEESEIGKHVFKMCDLITRKHVISIDNPVTYNNFSKNLTYQLVSSRYEIKCFKLPQRYTEIFQDKCMRTEFMEKEKELLQIDSLDINLLGTNINLSLCKFWFL